MNEWEELHCYQYRKHETHGTMCRAGTDTIMTSSVKQKIPKLYVTKTASDVRPGWGGGEGIVKRGGARIAELDLGKGEGSTGSVSILFETAEPYQTKAEHSPIEREKSENIQSYYFLGHLSKSECAWGTPDWHP